MFVRVRAAHHWRAHDGRGRWGKTDEIPPREEWLIAEWPKGKPEPTDYWISNLPVSTKPGRLARLARLRWKIELDYRQLKGRTRARPLRRPLLAGVVSPHRAGHRRPRVPDLGTAAPKSPAAGLTLPQAVQLLQPLFKCWTGRCSTCQQPVDLDQLPLHQPHQKE